MTRFQKEISGNLGEFWQKDAKKRCIDYCIQASIDATVNPDGSIFWNESGNYLPDDYCEVLEYMNYNFSRKQTEVMRDKQDAEYLAEYYKKQKGNALDEETLAEMRSTFEPGETVINIFTGDIYIV